MPIYVYECDKCGDQTEHILSIHADPQMNCHKCEGGVARRIIVASGQYCANQDSPWVRSSAAALLDPDIARKSHDPIERRLAETPNRENLKAYMKHKGLRIAENEKGGPPVYRKPERGPDRAIVRKQLTEKLIARRRIEI